MAVMHINHMSELEELSQKYHCFDYLSSVNVPKNLSHKWSTNYTPWEYLDKSTFHINIMILGKTGHGKSTTLNSILGDSYFRTENTNSCTKDLYCAMYRIDKTIPSFLVFSDMPGIGETEEADKKYIEWYKEILLQSDVVVYVLKATDRAYSMDEKVFKTLFLSPEEKEKVIIAINFAELTNPINRGIKISDAQKKNLRRKINDISEKFGINADNIFYYSAKDRLNLDVLVKAIARKIQQNVAFTADL